MNSNDAIPTWWCCISQISPVYLVGSVTKVKKKCASSFNPMSFQLQSNKKKKEKDLFLSDVMYSLA